MRRDGVLKSPRVIVNPRLFGRQGASVDLAVTDMSAKQKAISRIGLIDGVVSVLDFQGPGLSVGFFGHPLGFARQISLMEAACGCKHSNLWEWSFPLGPKIMKKTDWVILGVLQKDSRKTLAAIAKETGVSSRTVNKRLGRMAEDHAFFLDGLTDFRRLGGLAYRLLIAYKSGEGKAQADRQLLSTVGNIEWSFTDSKLHSMFILVCENVDESERISGFVRGLAGVGDLSMDIIRDQTTFHERIQDQIDTKITSFSD